MTALRASRLLAAALVAAPLAGAGAAPPPTVRLAPGEELRYTVFFSTRQVGLVAFHAEAGGESVLTMDISDRGRGQSFKTRMRLDEGGVPTSEHVTGLDYWKNPVEETFERKGGRASWRNAAEHGERALSGPAFYLTLENGQEIGLLASALYHAEGRRLPLLPAGEARMERVGEARVARGGNVRDIRDVRDIQIHAISGLGFAPLYVWMDEQGLFFGRYDGFVTAVREGWEAAAPELVKAQMAAAAVREKALADRLARRPKNGLLAIRNARLFDAEQGTSRPHTTVVVAGERIRAVGPDGRVPIPKGAQVIDARGKALLPGLWDMHEHLIPTDGILDVAAGVTTARDMGNDLDTLLALRRRWAAGEAIGPRVVMACVIEGPGPYAAPTKVLASTEAEAVQWVDRYADAGCEQIKIYSSLDPKLVPAVAARTHALGLRLSGHVPFGMRAEEAVRAGFDEIQHANFLLLNFLDPSIDTRTMARMSAVGEHAAELDLASEPVRAFLRLLKERGTVIDPTVNTYEGMFLVGYGEMSPSLAPVASRLPIMARRALLGSGGVPHPESLAGRFRDSYRAVLSLVKALHDAGITIVAGTDAIAGFSLHRELEDYVAAGIPAADALRAATFVPAKVMKRDRDLGSIAPGKLADLILVDGDPAARISDVRRVVLTVKGGVMYDPAELYRAVGVEPVE